jgi:hypothetical protein
MIQLNTENVLLKPSQRRQITAWLKRAVKYGQRLGAFTLNLTLHRSGRRCEVRAQVQCDGESFSFHHRGSDWRDAMHQMVHMLVSRLHSQWVMRSMA